ncbi:uncharacterized protein LOC123698521 [Colias croceus]|uniref:uncharacterized protein LOC123698521 n=1 Tax=Colias crocea TaxID=72248 RepID=UPI001E27BF86|nr:uncharacterized protein LOC123698521 [Colias croceus]
MFALLLVALLTTVNAAPNSQDEKATETAVASTEPNTDELITIREASEYKLTITLIDYKEEDIEIRATKELLLIKLHSKHANGTDCNIEQYKVLPPYLHVNGTWTYENNILTITFPIDKEALDKGIQQSSKTHNESNSSSVEEDSSEEDSSKNSLAQRFPSWWSQHQKIDF